MKALDDQKLADNTFVFFTSDNGPEGDGRPRPHPRLDRRAARPEAVDVRGRHPRAGDRPLAGQIKPGTTCDAPVIGSDFFPTVLGAGGREAAGRPRDRRGRRASAS